MERRILNFVSDTAIVIYRNRFVKIKRHEKGDYEAVNKYRNIRGLSILFLSEFLKDHDLRL